ncbi:hypothetical protein ADK52_00255 [Streptomyces sp. WM6372]|uniref:hypothetical protein n=1 Tax=Streptomyces sp. WM6372 TaxID=1415555 RepID=UPI0006ADC5AD|nr:hypothetical protein [Streptomyces sp. WM6372]KOU32757.1 hypothetical protein ADK52_00255 [Streptomyces sp. WM6372]
MPRSNRSSRRPPGSPGPLGALPLGALLLAAALTACTGGSGGSGDTGKAGTASLPAAEPKVSVTPQADPVHAGLPLDAYAFDKEQLKVMQQAQDILTDACMHRLGFAAFKNSNTYANTGGEHGSTGIGLVDAEYAKKFGYRTGGASPDRPRDTKKQDPNETAALYGPQDGAPAQPGAPEGGCSGEATRKLYPQSGKAGTKLLDELTQQTNDRARGDSRVVAAIGRWSACMRDAGFQVKTPWELQDMEGTRWTGPVTSEEVTAATTDVSCKQKSKLTDTWTAVLTAYQNTAVEKNKDGLGQEKKNLAEQVKTAGKVLKDGTA